MLKAINVLISTASYPSGGEVYLPYVYGLLRSCSDRNPVLKRNVNWLTPIYRFSMEREYIENLVERMEEAPDVFGVSLYIWNSLKQLYLAKKVKEKFPKCLVVAGGPGVPNRAMDFFERFSFVDFAVHGEGEEIFSRLLEKIVFGSDDYSDIPNLSTRARLCERVIRVPSPPIESPYLLKYFDKIAPEIRRDGFRVTAVTETSRGCPYGCVYCDWGQATLSKVRLLDLENTKAEIEWFAENKIDVVRFADANFGIAQRDEEIVDHLVAVRTRTGYPKLFDTAYAKNNPDRVLRISRKINSAHLSARGTTLALQSLNSGVLDNIKRKNLAGENWADLIAHYRREAIPTYVELIMGLPGETLSSFVDGIHRLIDMNYDGVFRTYPLELLPNSPAAEQSYRDKYALKTVKSRYHGPFGMEEDEEWCEYTFIVNSTSTMNTQDIVTAWAFVTMAQLFFCGGYTRYLSTYLRSRYGWNARQFYGELFDRYKNRPETSLGNALTNAIRDLTIAHSSDKTLKTYGPRWATYKFKGKEAGVYSTVFQRFFLDCVLNVEDLFSDIGDFIEELGILRDEELMSVLDFQKDLVIKPEYRPNRGKTAKYRYDHFTYYSGNGPLEKKDVTVKFEDTHMGPGFNYAIKTDDIDSFMKTVCGQKSILPNFFCHQRRAMRTLSERKRFASGWRVLWAK